MSTDEIENLFKCRPPGARLLFLGKPIPLGGDLTSRAECYSWEQPKKSVAAWPTEKPYMVRRGQGYAFFLVTEYERNA